MSEVYLETSKKCMAEYFYENRKQFTIFVKKLPHKCSKYTVF